MKKAKVVYVTLPNEAQRAAISAKYEKVEYLKQPKSEKEQLNLYRHITDHWTDMVFTEFCEMYNIALDASRGASYSQEVYLNPCPCTSHVYLCNTAGELRFPEQ